MSKQKCDWCGKNVEDVAVLLVGPIGNICDLCVTSCLQQLSQENAEEWKPKRAECSFCCKRALNPGERLIAGDGVYACWDCLSQLAEILAAQATGRAASSESFSAVISEEDDDCPCQGREETPKEREWLHLANEAADDKDFLRQGRVWLKQNKSDESAGKAIAMLLEVKPSASLVAEGLSWLRQNKTHDSAPELVGELLKADPSLKIVRLAGWYLKNSDDVGYLRPIIRAIIESPPHKGMYKKLEDLLSRTSEDDAWSAALMTTSKHRSNSSQSLVLKWLRLNVGNPEAYVSFHILVARSPEIIEAGFEWIRSGGRTGDDLTGSLKDLLRAAAKYHRAILPSILRYARVWLKRNPDHEAAGRVYASVLSASGSKLDIGGAKQWYQEHQSGADAWYVISDILDHGYWYNTKPDDYSVKEAQLLLRATKSIGRMPRLVGALLGAHSDEESIAWAKEAYARNGTPWILIRLLLRAPDAETISEAEAALERLKDHEELEPEMIYALLMADRKNKLALRRARVWLKHSPENKWIKAVTPLIRKAGKK